MYDSILPTDIGITRNFLGRFWGCCASQKSRLCDQETLGIEDIRGAQISSLSQVTPG